MFFGKYRIKRQKGLRVIAAVIALIFILSACGGSSRSRDEREAAATEATATTAASGQSEDMTEAGDMTEAVSGGPESQDFSQESIDELAGYVEQAEVLIAKADSEIEVISEEKGSGEPNGQDSQTMNLAERFRKEAAIMEKLLSDLSGLQKQAEAVSGIDGNLKDAAREYFSIESGCRNACREIWTFMGDYLDFVDNIIYTRPQTEEYASAYDYYYAVSEWYEAAKAAYGAIDTCPSCMESEWKRYGEILDLNESISRKTALANNYKDDLRWQSVRNMSERYMTAEELQYQTFAGCLKGERTHAGKQRNISRKLAEEIQAYAKLGEAERGGYEFEYIRTGKIFVGDDIYDAVDTIYPSLYNTYDAFLIIKTGCISGNRKVQVEAEIPGFTQKYKETFTLDSSYREIKIKPPALTGDLALSLAKEAQMQVSISEMDGTLLEAKTFPVTIKSKYDFEWSSDEYGIVTRDNILCFLTPESSAVAELKRQAVDEISAITKEKTESFVGYQNTKWNNHYMGTYLQVTGIMRAMYESGVRYVMDTFSISGSNQHILFPEDVLEQKNGLCIETSLVVASALQSAGMHVFLVFPPGHAQVAVEIWNGKGEDTAGTGEYFLIETTALSSDSNNDKNFVDNLNTIYRDGKPENGSGFPITYYDQEGWQDYITSKDVYLIDCDDSRVLGLTPFAN